MFFPESVDGLTLIMYALPGAKTSNKFMSSNAIPLNSVISVLFWNLFVFVSKKLVTFCHMATWKKHHHLLACECEQLID